MAGAGVSRKYTTLILGLGTYEGSKVTTLTVGGWFKEPFETPKEILTHFRTSLVALVMHHAEVEEEHAICARCEVQAKDSMNRFCGWCGKRIKHTEPQDFNGIAAGRFASWFEQEMHELSDWELMEQNGWQLGWVTSGGFVKVDGFETILEDWEDPDWKDNLGEDRSWWDHVLSDCTLGEISLDGNQESVP